MIWSQPRCKCLGLFSSRCGLLSVRQVPFKVAEDSCYSASSSPLPCNPPSSTLSVVNVRGLKQSPSPPHSNSALVICCCISWFNKTDLICLNTVSSLVPLLVETTYPQTLARVAQIWSCHPLSCQSHKDALCLFSCGGHSDNWLGMVWWKFSGHPDLKVFRLSFAVRFPLA